MKKVPEFLHFNTNTTPPASNNSNRSSIIKMLPTKNNPYSKLDAIRDIKDELDQPLQPHIGQLPSTKCSYVTQFHYALIFYIELNTFIYFIRSTLQAFGNTIKSFVGVGILALPYAMRQSGLWVIII